jgi:UDP-N-acetylmuramate dehydrogenase
MIITKNKSLQTLHTFGFEVRANAFAEFEDVADLKELLNKYPSNHFILGGGSNICFTEDYEGLVALNKIKGKQFDVIDDHVIVTGGAGENWHEFVLWTLENNWGGLENMSLIPGTLGAAPIQNIGAYGVELKDVFVELSALNKETLEVEVFDKDQCEFGYRDSFFKNEGKNKYVILNVTFKLSLPPHQLNTSYGAIQTVLDQKHISNPGIRDVSNAVIEIRQSKLPDPAVIGNAGSFFKNPVIDASILNDLLENYPAMPQFKQVDGTVKIPAGWLIEQCGWKGKRIGSVGCHKDQALVLVHFGGGSGKEILQLAQDIQASVAEKFGITIHPEVNVL